MANPTALSLLSRASRLDAEDPLRQFRDQFVIEENGPIYLDGNSLGRMPRQTAEVLRSAADAWSSRLVRGWNEEWMPSLERIPAKLAQLIGAKGHEVAFADSTTVNLFKLTAAALKRQYPRRKIVTDALNFHSDRYVFQGLAEFLGAEVVEVPSRDGIGTEPEDLEALLDEDVALLALTHTSFKTAALHDMRRLTAAAHEVGALAVWDLSHSVGALPVDLNGCQVDLAVGCGYKYLNGGPGAPAFLYVREELQGELSQPIWGWLGHRSPFDFAPGYESADGMGRFISGTPPILSLLAMEPGIDLLLEAGMDRIRTKSVQLSEFMIEIWRLVLEPLGIGLATPSDPKRRGSHVSLTHADGLAIDLSLIHDKRVIPDFRAPNIVRFGLAPLYNTFSEVAQAMLLLEEVVLSKSYLNYKDMAVLVT